MIARSVKHAEEGVSCRLVIIDGPDSWAKELVDERVAEKFYGIDFTDESTIFDRCLASIKEAEKVRPMLGTQQIPYPSASCGAQLALERSILQANS